MQRTWGGQGEVMSLPTCAARLAALSVLPGEPPRPLQRTARQPLLAVLEPCGQCAAPHRPPAPHLLNLDARCTAEDDSGLSAVQTSMYTMQRHTLYRRMAEDVESRGLTLGGVITQGLKQDDLFHITVLPPEQRRRRLSIVGPRSNAVSVSIEPVLKPLQVRARGI